MYTIHASKDYKKSYKKLRVSGILKKKVTDDLNDAIDIGNHCYLFG